jgi:pSer/pThr/pTyr-binding forkhead associated (FHA) protein
MAMLVQFHDGVAVKKFPLNKSSFRIGRDPDSDVFINEAVVSSEHAVIHSSDEQGTLVYYIEDLNSTNRTFVNGEPVSRQKLNHDDEIRIGWKSFRFIEESPNAKQKTSKIYKSWIPRVFYTKEE